MLSLFYKPTCPFCQKVLEFAEKNNIQLDLQDTSNQYAYDKLMEYGGKQTVPFLYDEDSSIAMYESDDIINHLKLYL